ncbi:hypothetical protein BDF20DRAFT_814475 [Mycotypha africana]|uniref:uncharacterized protein n=1 Tax=Mycotypha africana TaxID=64632 RepID=UPI002300CAB7|nr:uncharacterized protein BDF20DRAFT_814475 [Mycotypha africana]KAI8988308.1 hypothetical protein BDF20DRAFT_814475 [Mycotypha africana]
MARFHLRKGLVNYVGLCLSIIGFILTVLCLAGCLKPSSYGFYFAKITDAEASSDGSFVSIYFGWQAYCVQESNQPMACYNDRSIMVVPFDVSVSNQLNETYPRLFIDKVEQDEALNPGASPNPPHDPKIYPAAVLCLICSAILLVCCLYRVTYPSRYQDEYFTRGFLALVSAVFALLLVILSTVMYSDAVDQLNRAYPHLQATEGTGLPMIGCAFAAFTIAGFILLRGCMSIDSNDNDGYSPI